MLRARFQNNNVSMLKIPVTLTNCD